MKLMKISQFAKVVDAQISTIRYYDSLGLLDEVVRDEKNYRWFTKSNITCYNNILLFKSAGFSIETIQSVKNQLTADQPNFSKVSKIIDVQKEVLNATLKQTQEQINQMQIIDKFISIEKGE